MKDLNNLASINIKHLANMLAFALLSDPNDVPWSRTINDILGVDTPPIHPEARYQPIIIENIRFILKQGNGLHGNLIEADNTEGSQGEVLHLLAETSHVLYGLNICNESELQHQAKITQFCYLATRLFGGKVANISGAVMTINLDSSIANLEESVWLPFIIERSNPTSPPSDFPLHETEQENRLKSLVTPYLDSTGQTTPHLGVFELLAEMAVA